MAVVLMPVLRRMRVHRHAADGIFHNVIGGGVRRVIAMVVGV